MTDCKCFWGALAESRDGEERGAMCVRLRSLGFGELLLESPKPNRAQETTAVQFCTDAACGQDAASFALFLFFSSLPTALLLSSRDCSLGFLVRPLPHSPKSDVLLVYILICGSYPESLCICTLDACASGVCFMIAGVWRGCTSPCTVHVSGSCSTFC